tara:strand:+ start:427 stop:639 length:213 start_codon:yes stop_codon:yes gene_type:complete
MTNAEVKAKSLVTQIITDLFDKRHVKIMTEDAMVLAHLTVDEIINTVKNPELYVARINYWKEVKKEIDLL